MGQPLLPKMRRGSVMLPPGGFNVMSSGPGEALGVDEEKLQPLKPGRVRRGSGIELSLPEDKSAAEIVKSRRNSANVEDLSVAEGRRASQLKGGWRQMFDVEDHSVPAPGVDDALLAARAALPAGSPLVMLIRISQLYMTKRPEAKAFNIGLDFEANGSIVTRNGGVVVARIFPSIELTQDPGEKPEWKIGGRNRGSKVCDVVAAWYAIEDGEDAPARAAVTDADEAVKILDALVEEQQRTGPKHIVRWDEARWHDCSGALAADGRIELLFAPIDQSEIESAVLRFLSPAAQNAFGGGSGSRVMLTATATSASERTPRGRDGATSPPARARIMPLLSRTAAMRRGQPAPF